MKKKKVINYLMNQLLATAAEVGHTGDFSKGLNNAVAYVVLELADANDEIARLKADLVEAKETIVQKEENILRLNREILAANPQMPHSRLDAAVVGPVKPFGSDAQPSADSQIFLSKQEPYSEGDYYYLVTKALSLGKRIRRQSWDAGVYIVMQHGEVVVVDPKLNRAGHWTASTVDRETKDWVVLEDTP